MALSLVECVPNISNALDLDIVDAVCSAATKSGSKLLNLHRGLPANRSVLTLVGSPSQIEASAFELIAASHKLIDMRIHRGNHPRLGACDVCPIIPLSGVSQSECLELTSRIAKRVASELDLPVYLYEYSASSTDRRALPDVRRGEFEGLAKKISTPEWHPDFGPATPHPSAGAVIIGVRKILVAFNVALETQDVEIAKKIAAEIRSSSKSKYRLNSLRAIGWYHSDLQVAQVSMNLLDFRITTPKMAFEAVKAASIRFGVNVARSELVGMMPLAALLPELKSDQDKLPLEYEKCAAAARQCGLDSESLSLLECFKVQDHVLEYRLKSLYPQWNSVL